jgi:hypothetical protein
VEAARLRDVVEAAAEHRDPLAHAPAVDLELRLARTAGADAAAETRQVRPRAREARQQVLELRELDLQLVALVEHDEPLLVAELQLVEDALDRADVRLARRILVMNKVDLLPEEERARLPRGSAELPVVAVSARDGATTLPLLEAVEAALANAGFTDIAQYDGGDAAGLPS